MVQAGTADGLKTGHTDAGGFGLVASSLRDGRRVVMVLNGMTSMHERAKESEKLMNWAFANFENVTLFSANEVIDNAPVWLGTNKTVPLVGGRDLVVTLPKSWRQTASIKISYDAPIKAPIAKGQPVGRADVARPGRALDGREPDRRRGRAAIELADARPRRRVALRLRRIACPPDV